MTMRVLCGFIFIACAMTFWWLWDNASREHIPFDLFDWRSIGGLLAWLCASVGADAGAAAFRSRQ